MNTSFRAQRAHTLSQRSDLHKSVFRRYYTRTKDRWMEVCNIANLNEDMTWESMDDSLYRACIKLKIKL